MSDISEKIEFMSDRRIPHRGGSKQGIPVSVRVDSLANQNGVRGVKCKTVEFIALDARY